MMRAGGTAMPEHLSNADIFIHVRLVMGFIVSLSIARLLTGMTRFIQHPTGNKIYPVHLMWSLSMLLMLVHFWWWEFALYTITNWTFEVYLFLVAYAILLFVICTVLYPDQLGEYKSYEEYFYSRRKWFFGLFGLTFVVDIADTIVKGPQHFDIFGPEYWVRAPVYIVLCAIAMFTTNRKYHYAFVILSIVYQISFILRLFRTLI
jgi:hypothetical protein